MDSDSRCKAETMRTKTLILSVLAATVTSISLAQNGPLTLEDIVQLRQVAGAQISPDGSRIAYLLEVPRTPYVDESGGAYRELHITDLDGDSRGYITGEVNIGAFDWSPDGETVYYLAERNDDDEYRALYSIPLDGGESERLYSHGANIESFAPSPDGNRIAFLATDAAPSDREQLSDLGFHAVVYEESSLPTRVWTLDLEDEEPEAIAADLEGSASEFRWAPDGERYVVALAPTPRVDDHYVRRHFYIVDSESGDVLNRLDSVGKLGEIEWSPDGSQLAFVGGVDASDPLEGRIYIAAANGEGVRLLTPEYPGHVQDIAWRDDETLWYRGARGLWTEIAALSIDGTSVTSTPPSGDPIVRSFDMAGDAATFSVIADAPNHPRELFVWTEAGGYRRLTESNPGLSTRPMSEQETVTYNARDGLELEGVLVRPLDSDGERHPLVLVIHGGPRATTATAGCRATRRPRRLLLLTVMLSSIRTTGPVRVAALLSRSSITSIRRGKSSMTSSTRKPISSIRGWSIPIGSGSRAALTAATLRCGQRRRSPSTTRRQLPSSVSRISRRKWFRATSRTNSTRSICVSGPGTIGSLRSSEVRFITPKARKRRFSFSEEIAIRESIRVSLWSSTRRFVCARILRSDW